jgi:aldehyde:ferredoxin oxidoreductase
MDIAIIKLQETRGRGRYKIIRVPLTTIPMVTKLVLGGRGLNSAILWSLRKHIPVHWKHPNNVIVIGVGPFVGSTFPSTGRTTISVLKSPVTGFWSDGNLGGYFGAALRRSGLAAIIITGKISEPHSIYISKTGSIRLVQIPRSVFYSYGTSATTGWIESKYYTKNDKTKVSTLAIGPAGAKGVFCAVPISGDRTAGGGGTGAVFGEKRIKSITIEYEQNADSITFQNDDKKLGFENVAEKAEKKIKSHPVFDMFSSYGTTSLIEIHSALDYLPVNNWSKNNDPRWKKVSGKALKSYQNEMFVDLELFEQKQKDNDELGCSNCPICCSNIGKTEYETLNCLGPKIGIYDLEFITTTNICDLNDAGLDVIQSTSIIASLMNMSEDGVLLYPFKWGDKKAVREFFEELGGTCLENQYENGIAKYFVNGFYEGILLLLQEKPFHFCWDRFEQIISDDSVQSFRLLHANTHEKTAKVLTDYYYVHSKGYGLSGVYINDKNKGVALAAATSSRGADHLRSLPTLATYADWYMGSNESLWSKFRKLIKMPLSSLWMMKSEQKNLFGNLYKTYQTTFGVPKKITDEWQNEGFLHNKEQTKGWGSMLKFCQEMYAVSDALGTCKFTSTWRFGVGPELLSEALNYCGIDKYSWETLMECGERINALERQLRYHYPNLTTNVHDDIPQKFYSKAIKDPISRVTMRNLITDYYDRCGYRIDGQVLGETWDKLFNDTFQLELDELRTTIVFSKRRRK